MTADDKELWVSLLKEACLRIGGSEKWHWFSYHFSHLPPHPFARSIVDACADCERKLPGLGFQFIEDIAAIAGRENDISHYDQLLQKLSELLILRRLLTLNWPQGTTFEHEPAITSKGKRPELRVAAPDGSYLFEVKAPAMLRHIETRNTNPFQLPGRALPVQQVMNHIGGAELTLPRDNPVKDFLIDADKKFEQFKAVQPHVSVLVIVWDDYVYEPITALKHERCGLLTPNSFFKDSNGDAVRFANIDAVIVVRHATHFIRAAGGEELSDREFALDFGDERALPNVFFPITDPDPVPTYIKGALRAITWDDERLQRAADYRPKDIVMWMQSA